MKIAKEIVMTMIHHRLLPEFALIGDNIEINDAVNIIVGKLSPIRNLLVNSKYQSNPTFAYELVDKAIEMLG